MIILPAIDIKDGKCVRLRQGNFTDATIYSQDPVEMAKKWISDGAKMLHIVDLDGAKNGSLINFNEIKKIVANVNIPVQVGGGITTEDNIKQLLSIGVAKLIISTLAIENEKVLKSLLNVYADKIIVSLDSRNGKLAKKGWIENTNYDLIPAVKRLEKIGVKKFIHTNILKDGTLTQPDYEGITLLLSSTEIPIVVAGGISSISDIKTLKMMGVDGVIIGKALYENKMTIKEANDVS